LYYGGRKEGRKKGRKEGKCKKIEGRMMKGDEERGRKE
jgi:hypothetical protein